MSTSPSASGKDSTIKHTMSCVNPQAVAVRAFKQPSAEELNHDFLWRYQCALPGRGRIGIFNRSHYEEVLVVRMHQDLLAAQRLPAAATKGDVWDRRYREMNDWERYLVGNGIHVVKIMLNVRERRHWDDYQRAFDSMLSHTSTQWAPWHVVPADHRWFSHLATAGVLVTALSAINPRYRTATGPSSGPQGSGRARGWPVNLSGLWMCDGSADRQPGRYQCLARQEVPHANRRGDGTGRSCSRERGPAVGRRRRHRHRGRAGRTGRRPHHPGRAGHTRARAEGGQRLRRFVHRGLCRAGSRLRAAGHGPAARPSRPRWRARSSPPSSTSW
jgi:hypothetical protein